MIQQLTIKNFQSHKDTELLLSPGVNCFVGTNDSGKSSIIRAIGWLAFNRPRGSGFIRHGTKECQVNITLNDHVVSRLRGGARNEYILGNEVLEALGSSVPQQIQEVLNLQPINIQSQHDPMFMVFDPPGKIASTINSAVHLDKAEEAANRLSANIRENQRNFKQLTEQKELLGLALKRFVKLGQYKTLLDKEIALGTSLDRSTGVLADLKLLRMTALAIEKRLESAKIPEGFDDLLVALQDKLEKIEYTTEQSDDLSKIAQNIKNIDRKLGQLEDIPLQEEILDRMRQVLLSSSAIKTEVDGLSRLSNDIIDVTNSIFELKIGQKSLENEYNKLLGELDVCPTCGQELDDEHRKMVLENVK